MNIRTLIITFALLSLSLFYSCNKEDDNPADNDNALIYSGGMVLIKAQNARFQMGSDEGFPDEQPVHTVSFTYEYWMDTVEVSQGEYHSLMVISYPDYLDPTWQATYGAGDDYPAYSVYWGDAALYCNARSRQDGLDSVYTYTSIIGVPGCLCQLENVVADYSKNGYRLPTEAEWEFACRAGANTDFFWGKDCDPYPATTADSLEVDSYCVWYRNSWECGTGYAGYGTHPVGTKTANAYGLYDMAGNVYEWCNDWYGSYSSGSATDPTGPSSGTWHAIRGGSWGNYAYYLRSSNRTFSCPGYEYYFLGFRCVRIAE